MKAIGQILSEIGFNKGSDLETQKAFMKYLIDEAHRQELENTGIYKNTKLESSNKNLAINNCKEPAQLAFDLEGLDNFVETKSKKVS